MPAMEKIDIALPPEMADMVRRAVASGAYASASEVVSDALRDWRDRRAGLEEAVSAVRRSWEAGLASGPGRFEDFEALMAEARSRLDASRKNG